MRLTLAADALRLRHPDGSETIWNLADVSVVDDELHGGPLRLACDDARLTVGDPDFAAALFACQPRLRHRHRTSVMVAGIAAAVFALLAAGLWWRGSELTAVLAEALPRSWERAAGDQLMAQLPFRQCDSGPGKAALDKLSAALVGDLRTRPAISVGVYDVPVVNALALPGGHVLVLNGLLRQAETPQEVAGVLAHEIGHVLHHDPTRGLLAQAGIGLAVQLATGGGNGGSLTTQLLSLSYSRGVEAAADAEAARLLNRSGIGTRGLADFFDRLAKHSPELLPPFLNSHPPLSAREAAVNTAQEPLGSPILSVGEWQALREICSQTK